MTEFVKALRLKGWSAQQVAKRWGVSPRRISQIGKNPSKKDWDALNGLADNMYIETHSKIRAIRDAVLFFDKVQSSSEEDRDAVGFDHYNLVVKTARELVGKSVTVEKEEIVDKTTIDAIAPTFDKRKTVDLRKNKNFSHR